MFSPFLRESTANVAAVELRQNTWSRCRIRPQGKLAANLMAQMQELLAKSFREFKEGSIVKGRVLEIRPREVLVDIGYKSEGVIPTHEFEDVDSMEVGDEVEVLLERLEN